VLKISKAYIERSVEQIIAPKGAEMVRFFDCPLNCIFCGSDRSPGNAVAFSESGFINVLKLFSEQRLSIAVVTCLSQDIEVFSKAVGAARAVGVTLPLFYLSNGFESEELIAAAPKLFDGVIFDFLFGSDELGEELAGVKGYFKTASAALKEFASAFGSNTVKDGVIERGLLIRHTVLPGYPESSKAVIDFLAKPKFKKYPLSLGIDYRPKGAAESHPLLSRSARKTDVMPISRYAILKGLHAV